MKRSTVKRKSPRSDDTKPLSAGPNKRRASSHAPVARTLALVYSALNRYVTFETTEGLIRSAKITNFNYHMIKVNGKERPLIASMELNGDPSDYVDFSLLLSIDIHE